MTPFARQAREVVLAVRSHRRLFFSMAILTRDRRMRALQGEGRILVLFQRKCGRMEAFHLMAIFAAVEMRRAHELSGMRILVAIQARLGCRVIIRI